MVHGKVTHLSLAGGFWGIVTDDGKKLLPVPGLPANFQREALRVAISYRPSSAASVYMWGQSVTITHIEALQP